MRSILISSTALILLAAAADQAKHAAEKLKHTIFGDKIAGFLNNFNSSRKALEYLRAAQISFGLEFIINPVRFYLILVNFLTELWKINAPNSHC